MFYLLWQHVAMVGSWQWCWDLGSWPVFCFFPSKIWPTSGRVNKCQNEWAFTNSYITNWIVKIGQIALQNYNSAALNTKYIWAISWDLEIFLLYGNFYSGSSSSCMRFDLYHTFPGSSKIPFPSTLFPLRKEVSQEILKHCSQWSSQTWIIFNCQKHTPFPHCFASWYMFPKWQLKKRKRHFFFY